jgi:hypothetical protein
LNPIIETKEWGDPKKRSEGKEILKTAEKKRRNIETVEKKQSKKQPQR